MGLYESSVFFFTAMNKSPVSCTLRLRSIITQMALARAAIMTLSQYLKLVLERADCLFCTGHLQKGC